MNYRPEIDGLRTIAVVPVILFHAGISAASGGFVGVDVFFVISGFLIAGLILDAIDAGRFSFADFYARRARRILPALALVVVVVVTTPFAWAWMLPLAFKDYAQSVAAASVSLSNVLFWLESGYFAPAAELKPLLHTWSLGVEEQYYVVIPLLLVILWSRSRPSLTIALAAIFVASLAASEALWRLAPDANFYLLPSRAWELVAGSLGAVLVRRRELAASPWLSSIGLAMIVGSVVIFDDGYPFPSLWALIPVLGTLLVLVYGTGSTPVARLLSHKAPVAIGLISYSAYLWHQPILALAQIRFPVLEEQTLALTALAALSFPLAYLSWRFVEQPSRRGPGRNWIVLTGAATVSIAFFAAAAILSSGPWHESYFRASISAQNQFLLAKSRIASDIGNDPRTSEDACRFATLRYDDRLRARFERCASEHGPALVVAGDSHSVDVYHALLSATDRAFVIHFGQGDCRPHVPDSPCEGGELDRFLAAEGARIGLAVYVQAGFWLAADPDGDRIGRALFQPMRTSAPVLDTVAIDRVIAQLERFARHGPLVWLGPRVEPFVPIDTILDTGCDRVASALSMRPWHAEFSARLDSTLAARSRGGSFDYLSEQALVGFDIRRDLYDCDHLYWADSDHWAPDGEIAFGPRIAPELLALFNREVGEGR